MKLCYIQSDYNKLEKVKALLGTNVIIDKSADWHMALLSEPDINYIKLSFPKTLIVHEGGKYDFLDLSNCNKITCLPKNIEVNEYYIVYTDIHYIHSTTTITGEIYARNSQLYHIPKHGKLYSTIIVKNYKQEKEKLDRIGEEAYYKEIDEICEKMYESEIARLII